MKDVTPRIRTALIAAYLLIQTAVPALMLFAADRPARFGWQMYSGSRLPQFWRISANKARVPVGIDEVRSIVGVVRSELDYERYVPPVLCARAPRTTAIDMTIGNSKKEFRCP